MFLTQIVNGQVTELALCEECARKRGLFDPQALTFSEKFFPEELKLRVDKIVRELVESAEQAEQESSEAAASGDVLTQCPACGFPLETYRKTGRLGCPDCYGVFARELEPSGSPAAAAADDGSEPAAPAESAAELEKQMRAAVAREDYETAARLRDRLRSLSPDAENRS